ncbi:MAG: ferrous iron transport protein B [Verrucomicrobia bacterium]|nr:ferrous iron transport protein B [Verrucomicrobiota bacterium]
MNSARKGGLKIVLVGNPNSGKTSLFNNLTGLRQQVGNFPGVTVEKKQGKFILDENEEVEITDLPGLYSLHPKSEDEEVSVNYLESIKNKGQNDLIVLVADTMSLKRNILLATQIAALGKPMIMVLNMMDLAQKNQMKIDLEGLRNELGFPIVSMNARIGKGIDQLKTEIMHFLHDGTQSLIFNKGPKVNNIDDAKALYERFVKENKKGIATERTAKLDHFLTHPVYGVLSFLFILFLIFQAIFSWSTVPMDWIENGFLVFGNWVGAVLPTGVLNDLIVDGIIAGLGGIIIFIPQIALLFFFIGLMEDTGYLSRVSFMMDKLLRGFGLNGRSIIPMLGGAACAVPAIMSARIIGNRKERLLTIFVTPLISCSARIPVYTLLIALIIPSEMQYMSFNLQGIVMMSLYLLGFIAALLTAFFMKYIVKSKQTSHFTMEMPLYRPPRWSNIGITVFNKVKTFLFEAGKIIIAVSIVLWVMSSYGPGDKMNQIEQKYSSQEISNGAELMANEKLEASYAGHLGKFIEPVIEPLGFDWKIGIAVITSFAAREVFVGTMATLYSIGDEENTIGILDKMRKAEDPTTGEKIYTKATGFSLLIFYAFALQCMATVAIVVKETGGWKWPIIQLLYMSSLAYLSSLMVYQFFH